MTETCGNCAFSMKQDELPAEHLRCRRLPPIVLRDTLDEVPHENRAAAIASRTAFKSTRPIVHETNWCGEWLVLGYRGPPT